MFNIIARRTLNEYGEKYAEARLALQKWYHEMAEAEFRNFNELKAAYGSASLIADDRVGFNLCGNKYRLVARFNFQYKAIQVKWFGTHKEYDKVDVVKVTHKKKKR